MDDLIFFSNRIKRKKIIIATLDWGMGHTTRSVSIIRKLIDQKNEVVFAGNEKQRAFIQADFPGLKTIELKGYGITLNSNRNTYLQLMRQVFRFNGAIRNEKKWLERYCNENEIDLIISDNRYGFYHNSIPSVIITHQLQLQVPRFREVVNRRIRKYIENFNCCWVPDTETHDYAGELSKGELNIPIQYIGLLNRFEKPEVEKKYDVLIILSGPEPERTNFLEFILRQERNDMFVWVEIAFVGTEVEDHDSFPSPTTKELGVLIAQSREVISRAGYTTIMEMIGLEKKAILLPTKGQYEQIFLAKHLSETGNLIFSSWMDK